MKPFFLLLSLCLTLPVWAQNRVVVRVLDPQNAPVAGATVETQIWSEPGQAIAPQITGKDGIASLEIPAGEDGKPAVGNFCVVAPGFAFTNRLINAKDLDIRLEAGATWRGKIVDEAGKPIAGAVVRVTGAMKKGDWLTRLSVFGEKNRAAYAATSGADGGFEIGGVPTALELQFQVLHPNYALKNGNGVLAGAEATLKLAPGGALQGRVTDVAGKPVAGAAVGVYSMQIGAGGNIGKTDENGSYTVASLAAGAYKVRASVELLDKNPPFIFPRLTDVRVESGKTLQAPEVRAIAGVVISGTVRDAATQKPLAGASIIAQAKDETDAYNTSDATGHFHLRVAAGSYKVYISGAPQGYTRPDAQKTVVAGETAPAEVVFELQKAHILRGIMVDEAGKRVQGQIRFGYGETIEADAKGNWQFQPSDQRKLQLVGGDAENIYYEVVSPPTLDPMSDKATTIVLRQLPWQVLPGRAVTTDGKGLEGVQVSAEFSISMGDGSGILDTSQRTAISNANGDFVLPQIRDGIPAGSNYLQISAKKDGYAFQKGGLLSKNGPFWQVSNFVFAPLNRTIEGQTVPGARVTVAGLEAIAGADGRFKFDGLPATDFQIWAVKGSDFGGEDAKTPLQIALKTQEIQPRDPQLARDIWNELLETSRGAHARNPDLSAWIERRLAPAPADGFAAQLARAPDDSSILSLTERLAGKADAATLETAIARIKDADLRVYAALSVAAKSGDRAMSLRALQAAGTNFATPENSVFTRENNLYLAAALTAQVMGEAPGLAVVDRAVAYTLKNHPEATVVKDAMEMVVGRDDALARQGEVVAAGGLPLVRRVMQQIEPGSGFEAAILVGAIPVLARRDGAASTLALFDELEAMPEPVQQGEARRRVSQSPEWAFAAAAIEIVPLLGATSPQQALQLARRVKDGAYNSGHRAQALAGAAKSQTAPEAARLWREILRDSTAMQAPRYAARAWELDPQLGREMFEVARQKVEDESKNEWQGRRLWAAYGFYLARADAAGARFLIEREWGAARQKQTDGDDLSALALAMAAIDGTRAAQMAREIPTDNFNTSLNTRRRIGIYLDASDALRRDFPFDRQNYEEWRALEE